MEEPTILKWDRVIHKSAITTEGEPIGYIAAEDMDFIIVLSSRSREYCIPKSRVSAYDGSQVYFSFPFREMEIYRII